MFEADTFSEADLFANDLPIKLSCAEAENIHDIPTAYPSEERKYDSEFDDGWETEINDGSIPQEKIVKFDEKKIAITTLEFKRSSKRMATVGATMLNGMRQDSSESDVFKRSSKRLATVGATTLEGMRQDPSVSEVYKERYGRSRASFECDEDGLVVIPKEESIKKELEEFALSMRARSRRTFGKKIEVDDIFLPDEIDELPSQKCVPGCEDLKSDMDVRFQRRPRFEIFAEDREDSSTHSDGMLPIGLLTV